MGKGLVTLDRILLVPLRLASGTPSYKMREDIAIKSEAMYVQPSLIQKVRTHCPELQLSPFTVIFIAALLCILNYKSVMSTCITPSYANLVLRKPELSRSRAKLVLCSWTLQDMQ